MYNLSLTKDDSRVNLCLSEAYSSLGGAGTEASKAPAAEQKDRRAGWFPPWPGVCVVRAGRGAGDLTLTPDKD